MKKIKNKKLLSHHFKLLKFKNSFSTTSLEKFSIRVNKLSCKKRLKSVTVRLYEFLITTLINLGKKTLSL